MKKIILVISILSIVNPVLANEYFNKKSDMRYPDQTSTQINDAIIIVDGKLSTDDIKDWNCKFDKVLCMAECEADKDCFLGCDKVYLHCFLSDHEKYDDIWTCKFNRVICQSSCKIEDKNCMQECDVSCLNCLKDSNVKM